MDEDNAFERRRKSRPILGNITNQIGNKRPFSSLLGNSSVKSVDRGSKNVGGKFVLLDDGDNAKRVCIGPRPCSTIRSSKLDAVSGISNVPDKNQDPNLSCIDSATVVVSQNTIGDNNDAFGSAIEIDNDRERIPKKNFEVINDMDGLVTGAAVPVPALSGTEDHDAARSCEINEVDSEGTESEDMFPNGPDEQGLDNLVMSQSGSVDFARLPESQESRVKLETCAGTQTCEDNSGLSASIESIKACSCTFCTKAAYMWLDLHYQDTKGRISAVKKSQREASLLVERSGKGKELQEGPEKNIEAANLESSLIGHWKSLFQHMEHMFQHEADQLESSLGTLTDLKERCKTELDSFNGTSENC